MSSEEEETSGGATSLEDEWIDALVPEKLEWKELVREHPYATLGSVAFAGFLVGRLHGERVIALGQEILNRRVNESLGAYGVFVDGRSGSGSSSDS